jgi:serine/threonine protein kinase
MLADQKRLEIEKALLILLDIVRGMKYATSKIPGLIHCDLKPENIFIGLDGRACVSDFGLVCTPGDIHESLSRSVPKYINNRSRPVGTPYYMSPERWRNRRVGVSADIYSLGCMFLEMLTGEHAVQGETVKALIEAHIRGEAITKAKGLSLPKTTSMFLCRCLEPDPKYRYQTWEEVETGLERMHEILLKRPAPRDTILYDVSKKGQVVLGETWFSIGEAHLDIREFRAALACFEKAREIGKAQNHSPLVALAEANIGLTYFKLGQPERGAVHYRRAAAQQERFAEGDTVKPTLAPGEEFSQTRQFG